MYDEDDDDAFDVAFIKLQRDLSKKEKKPVSKFV